MKPSELWCTLRERVKGFFGRHRLDKDLEDEIAFHLAMRAEKQAAEGLAHEEADLMARRQFGNATFIKEMCREAWTFAWLENLVADLKYAARLILKSPGLSFAAIVSLALGIGADAALFSAMDGVWLRPLPVKNPGGLVRMHGMTDRHIQEGISFADYLEIAKSSRTLAGLAASERPGPVLAVGGIAESTLSEAVSDNYFTVLGVNAALGRVFHEQPRMERELVISHGLWQRRFGGDPAIVGRQVECSGQPYVIVGVAPREFRGIELTIDIDLWVPLSVWEPYERFNRRPSYSVLGRLARGASLDQARAELEGIARNLAAAHPETNKNRSFALLSALEHQLDSGGADAAILACIVLVLLSIACANVANLLLARGEARRRELAIRLTIGCCRMRLIRQLLTESFLLAAIGAAAALALARWLIALLTRIFPSEVQLRLDHRVFLFTLIASAVTALIFGLLPALRVSRPELIRSLNPESPLKGTRFFPLRDGLVIAQMALSVVLLACAGLLVRSFVNCLHLDLGFNQKNILVVRLDPGLPESQARVFYAQLLERARALGGVRQAGLVRRAPLWNSEGGMTIPVRIPGQPADDDDKPFAFKFTTAGDNYLHTMGIPLVRGRDFNDNDNASGIPVAIINQTMARRFWPTQDAIGKVIITGNGETRQVVGVVKDTKINNITEAPEPYLYLPFGQDSSHTMSLMVETSEEPLTLADPIRSEIRKLAKIPVPEIETMKSLIRNKNLPGSIMASVVSSLGLLGFLLTAAGQYGVMSFIVTRRTREIGIRMALGALRYRMLSLILGRAVTMACIGAGIGIAGALALSGVLANLLFAVSPRDPLILGAVCMVLLVMAVLASLMPALRASAISPMEALRTE